MSYKLPVNLKSEQVWAASREHGREPVQAGACPTAADIPELLTEDDLVEWPKSRKGLAVFVQYWNNTTDEGRQRMASAEMPEADMDPEDLAAATASDDGTESTTPSSSPPPDEQADPNIAKTVAIVAA